MLPQEELIERVNRRCVEDEAVVAALMYGSFAKGEGDAYSDIEFWVFFQAPVPDAAEWVGAVAPLTSVFLNPFGTRVVLFQNSVRGEFHLEPAERIGVVSEWGEADPLRPETWVAERGGLRVVVDRTGELGEHTARLAARSRAPDGVSRARALTDGLCSFLLLGSSVLARGEYARALDALSHLHRYLIWMLRMLEGCDDRHWATPSRAAETDLSAAGLTRLARCSARLEPSSLDHAYAEVRAFARELMRELARHYGVSDRAEVLEHLDRTGAGDSSDG